MPKQGYRYHKTFSKFYRLHSKLLMSKYNVGLQTLLQEDISEPQLMVTVYKFRKIVCKTDFFLFIFFKKIVTRFKKIGYNMNILLQTARMLVKTVMVDLFVSFFNRFTPEFLQQIILSFTLDNFTVANAKFQNRMAVSSRSKLSAKVCFGPQGVNYTSVSRSSDQLTAASSICLRWSALCFRWLASDKKCL